jgi:hypothetical protein
VLLKQYLYLLRLLLAEVVDLLDSLKECIKVERELKEYDPAPVAV